MARSSYVYVVEVLGDAMFVFTVKHELVRWLRILDDHDPLSVWRFRDGWHRNTAPMELDIDELLKEERENG